MDICNGWLSRIKIQYSSIILIETLTRADQTPNTLTVECRESPIFHIISRNISRSGPLTSPTVCRSLTQRRRLSPRGHLSPVIILSITCLLPLQRGVYAVAHATVASTPELVAHAWGSHARASEIRYARSSCTNTHTRVQVRRGPSSCTAVCSTGERGWLVLDGCLY